MKFINRRDFIRIERSSVSLAFKKGETILKQGERPSHVVYLERGIVKFSYQNEAGKNLILTIVAAPKILGGANLFYKDNNLFSFVAVDDCDVVLIDAQVLLSVMENNAKFSIMLFQLASGMFKKSILNFISLAYKQKEGRIADIIIYLSRGLQLKRFYPHPDPEGAGRICRMLNGKCHYDPLEMAKRKCDSS